MKETGRNRLEPHVMTGVAMDLSHKMRKNEYPRIQSHV